jgi:predicted permease
MGNVLSDLRYAFRGLGKNPGFTAVVLLTLALGIGANSAIFSVVNAVLLEPLPYPESERIVRLWSYYTQRDMPPVHVSEGEFLDYQAQSRSFEAMGVFVSQDANLTGEGEPERVLATYTSHGFFPVLGVPAALGHPFGPEEDRAGGAPAVVISHGLWQRRFGSDPRIVGKSIQVNGREVPVAGVMPPDFQFPENTDLWAPLQVDPANQTPRGEHFLGLIARLKPGVSLASAQGEISSIAGRFGERFPIQYPPDSGWSVRLVPLLDEIVGESRRGLMVLLAAVALVLLIACVNVANLLLARAQTREREVAIRVALGAGRAGLVRQSLIEALLLALVGGGLGLLFAHWGIAAFLAINPEPVPRAAGIGLDGQVAGFTLALALLTGLVLGLVPALSASRPDLQASLKEGGKSTAGSGFLRFRRLLVGAEVAIALVLLIGAGLMIRSFAQLQRVDPGFNPENLLTLEITVSHASYAEDRDAAQFYNRLLDRIATLPGVESASSVSLLPFADAGGRSGTVGAEGTPFTPGQTILPEPELRSIDYRYFETLEIPVVRGRAFTAFDDQRAYPMAIVDEALARRLWPGQDAVGKRFKLGPPTEENQAPWVTVVGVAGETRQFGLGQEDSRGVVYFPQLRRAERAQYLVIRTESDDPLSLAGLVRRTVRSLNPDQPVANVTSMEERISRSLAQPRFSMTLLAAFAAIAAALAAIGIYGVVAYSVGQRTQEIGVRMALGAQRNDVLKLVVRQGMTVVLLGLGVGLVLAFWATRALAGLLYAVQTTDAMTFVTVPLFLTAVALVANLLPARRAAKLEPTIALRYE